MAKSAAPAANLDFPEGEKFTFFDEPGEHDPCYVVMPGGASLPLNHHQRPGVDIARAKFIVTACNAHQALNEALSAAKLFLEESFSPEAARQAYAAELGASEWEAFMPKAYHKITAALALADAAQEGEAKNGGS